MARTKIDSKQIQDSGIEDFDNDTKVECESSADEDKIRFDTAGAERMIITNAGLVGIGTNNPDYNLHVASAAASVVFVDGAANADAFLRFGQNGTLKSYIKQGSGGNLVITNETSDKDIIFSVKDNTTDREALRINGDVAEVVINEGSDSLVDFRVESNNQTHMLYVDGGTNTVGINDPTPASTLTVQGSLSMAVLSINASNDPGSTYTIATTDYAILINTRPTAEGGIDSAITLTLPAANSNPGMIVIVKDAAGYSNVNRIFVVPAGSDKIDGVISSFQIPAIGGWVRLISDGVSSWAQIG